MKANETADALTRDALTASPARDPGSASQTHHLTLVPLRNRPADASEEIDPLPVLRASGLFDAAWYLTTYPDLEAATIDLLHHYHAFGWREGRKPNLYFDPDWYLARRPDVKAAGMEPLLHYVLHGEAEGEKPCSLFDPAHHRAHHDVPAGWLALRHFLLHRRGEPAHAIPEFDAGFYLNTYPDIAAAGIDPLEHYTVQGFREGRQPSPDFDTRYYRQRYLRGAPEINPLLHYIEHKHEPGIFRAMPAAETTPYREARRFTQAGPECEPVRALPATAAPRVTALAFYLPQFHPIPENDAWWGEGFTEWTNLGRAMPRFAGHYQPRIPRDLGHYRLDGEAATSAVLARQIALAKGAGIGGFVFYYYWFNGRRLLERPVETLLADRSLAMPFCLMWANENWSRRWDGSAADILIEQDYEPSDDAALVASFARHFADPRYIRLDGRPLLMVYRPRDIPDAPAAVARWRALFATHGEDPLFVMAQSFHDTDPRPFGMDGAVEFPPHKLTQRMATIEHELDLLDPDFSAHVYDYEAMTRASLAEPSPAYPLIKTALPSWDNDPRRQGGGMVLHGSTPALYERWLEGLAAHARANPFHGEAIVCINAWNEWAEGAYLEPDLHYGAAYLNATGRALASLPAASSQGRLLLIGHDAFPAGAQRLLLALGTALRANHGVEIAFLLLGTGALLPAYERIAPTVIAADPASLAAAIASLRARGFARAILNSAASGRAARALDAAGIGFILLAHELPGLLVQRSLVSQAGEAARLARHVVFASEAGRAGFASIAPVAPSSSVILPQGLYAPAPYAETARADLRTKLELADTDRLALGMGHGDLRKGFDLFLQVWRLAQREARPTHFVWVGEIEPALRTALAAEIDAAIATGRFHLPGQIDQPASWYSAADIFLLTSREDPYPSVALEALSAGLPVIAFAGSGGIPGLLDAIGTGATVPLGDCLAFAEATIAQAGKRDPRLARHIRKRFAFEDYARALLRLALPERLPIAAVVPSYNYARYMPARLASIFAQTYPVESVAVIDDASDDHSLAASRTAAAAAGRRVTLASRRRNSGSVFRQWQRAASLARAEWVWIAEADDLAEPRFLERLAAAITSAGAGVVMAFTDSRAIGPDGETLMPSYQPYYRRSGAASLSRDGVFDGQDFLREHLSARNLILNASAVLWRRDALLAALSRCGGELDRYRVAGDWRVYVEMLSQKGARIAYVAEALNAHRRHGESVTGRLAADRHVEEIRRVQTLVATRQPVCARVQAEALREAAEALAVAAE